MFIKQQINKRKSLIFQAPKANWELRFASKRLLASDFEALEVSGTPRGDQVSLEEVSKSSKVTIHRACQVILTRPAPLVRRIILITIVIVVIISIISYY